MDNGSSTLLGLCVTAVIIVAFVCATATIGSSAIATFNGVGQNIERAAASVVQARADAEQAAIDYANRQRELALQVKQAEADAQARDARQRVESETSAVIAFNSAKSQMWTWGGIGASVLLLLSFCGAGLYALGFGAGRGLNSIATSQYVRIGVEPATLLPPPFVITRDGYLLATGTGERARLRDASGVDHLRIAATERATETALLARAVVDAAKASKSTTATESLAEIAAGVQTINGNGF